MTVVEELVSVLGLEIGDNALSTLSKFRAAVTQGLAGVGGIVAALGAAFAGTVVSVANLGLEIDTTSRKLGMGTDALQEYRYAADVTNVGIESLMTAMKFLSKNAAEGGDASKRILDGFNGIAMHDAKGNLKTAEVLFEDLADKIAATKDPIEQVKLAMHALHGQSGTEVLPLLKLGKKGIQDLREEAEALGYVLDKKTIESSKRFHVSLTRLKYALMGVRNEAGTPFIDDFSDAFDWMTERVRSAREWVQGFTKDIRDLGQRFGRVGETIKKTFSEIRKFVEWASLDKIAGAIDWIKLFEAALIGVATVATVSAAATAAAWVLAAAPFIILATLIGLIADELAHFATGGDSYLGDLVKWANEFNPEDSNVIKFFRTAIALLLDFTDPAKWARARDAFKSLWTGKSTDRLGREAGLMTPKGDTTEIPEEVAQPDWGHRAMRALGFHHPKGAFSVPATGAISSGEQLRAEDYLKQKGPMANDAHFAGMSPEERADAMRVLKRDQVMAPGATITINVSGSGDPKAVADHVVKKLNEANDAHEAAHSDAKAAITGGS